MSESGRAVEDLSDEDYDQANNALASLNTLGISYKHRYLRQKDLLETWADTILRLLRPTEKFLVHRNALRAATTRRPGKAEARPANGPRLCLMHLGQREVTIHG